MDVLHFAVDKLGTGLQTTLTDLFPGTVYEITVSAINGAGEGENSVIQVETFIGILLVFFRVYNDNNYFTSS